MVVCMAFPKSRIINTNQFINFFNKSAEYGQRFCFILGAGASIESGVPTGGQLATNWMTELMEGYPAQTQSITEKLYEEHEIEHCFDEIYSAWNIARNSGTNISGAYFFDLYKIRFHPNPLNGIRYLNQILECSKPSPGYQILSQLMTKSNQHNLVITTNYDNLAIDALNRYSKKVPLVIGHDSLYSFIYSDVQRPIITKVYNEPVYTSYDNPGDINRLQRKWRDALNCVFMTYTPIVIGFSYDIILTKALMDANSPHGIFWCYPKNYGLPNKQIQDIVLSNSGCFVEIDGFDAFMAGFSIPPLQTSNHQEVNMSTQATTNNKKSVFLSYSWDSPSHKKWVKLLYDRLIGEGFHVILDQVDLIPGDPMPLFMEQSIIKSDYSLIICTPKYKEKADARQGGVGYEESIITSDVLLTQNHRKYIPVLASGNWTISTPIWANGKYGIDLSDNDSFEDEFAKLVKALNR